MLDLLIPMCSDSGVDSIVSPFFTRISMERKLSHWDSLANSKTHKATSHLPTLDARGMHFFSPSVGIDGGSHQEVALAFSHCLSKHLPEDKVHRTTFPDFLSFLRQQLTGWQDKRRSDMMTPDLQEQDLDGGDNDPIMPVVDAISNHCWVLQLDDWNVASVTDAMLIRRVFTRLFNSGTFIVSSGNVPIDQFQSTTIQESKYLQTQQLLRKRMFSTTLGETSTS